MDSQSIQPGLIQHMWEHEFQNRYICLHYFYEQYNNLIPVLSFWNYSHLLAIVHQLGKRGAHCRSLRDNFQSDHILGGVDWWLEGHPFRIKQLAVEVHKVAQ